MNKYNNKMAEAIASYNAGPLAVTNWLKSKDLMMIDEFCEEIPYRETRRYVKKVMRSYYVYSILLDGRIDSIKIDTPIFMAKKWKQNINF